MARLRSIAATMQKNPITDEDATAPHLPAFQASQPARRRWKIAVVAPLLLALVFSTLEAGWMMTKGILLDRALDTAVRSVRTGQTPDDAQQMKTAVCANMLSCPIAKRPC